VTTPNTARSPEKTQTPASPSIRDRNSGGSKHDESFDSQERRSAGTSPITSGTDSLASVEFAEDDDIALPRKRKSAFELSFVQDSFPTLVVSAVKGRDANVKDVVKFTTAITDVLDRKDISEFVAVYDIRDLEAPSTPMVLEIANWCRVNEHRFRRRLRAAAIIMADNLWAKAVGACVWAVMCIAPPVCPFKIVADPQEAEDFLNAELQAVFERKKLKERKRRKSKTGRDGRQKDRTGARNRALSQPNLSPTKSCFASGQMNRARSLVEL